MVNVSLWPLLKPLFSGLLILLGALVLYGLLLLKLRRLKQDRLLKGAPHRFDQLTWSDFEETIVAAYRAGGYEIVSQPTNGADGGVDLVIEKNGERALIQCKHWKGQVGVKVVRELFGVMADRRVRKGVVVTTGGFTAEARDFAQRNGIELLDGGAVAELFDRARGAKEARSAPKATNARSCPKCSGPMLLRENHGTLATFWGCRQFPKCRGTLPA